MRRSADTCGRILNTNRLDPIFPYIFMFFFFFPFFLFPRGLSLMFLSHPASPNNVFSCFSLLQDLGDLMWLDKILQDTRIYVISKAWLWSGQERLGFLEPLMQSGVVRYAESLNLGIPYNHHAYFAGAVHQRKEQLRGNRKLMLVYTSIVPVLPHIAFDFASSPYRIMGSQTHTGTQYHPLIVGTCWH